MTNVTFSRKEFEKEVRLSPETIKKISLFGTPLEKITKEEIEIEIFPNRPDLISLQGYLRSFKVFLDKSPHAQTTYKINKPLPNYQVIIDNSVKNIRPYTACAIIKNIHFDDQRIKEIVNLQEKLHVTVGRNRKKVAIGIYPLEKIKLPIKYTAKKPAEIKFIPLEEKREMTAMQILKKHPAGKDYANLLKKCKEFPIFIDSTNKILSMPPIINSNSTGKVTVSTRDIFIECSGFDLSILKKTLNIVVTTLADMGGKVYQMNLHYSGNKETTPDLSPEKMKISLENTNKLLGLDLKEEDIEKLLANSLENRYLARSRSY